MTIPLNVGAAHLQQIIERAGDQMTLLDLGDARDRGIEGLECGLTRITKPHLHKGHVIAAQLGGIQKRPVAKDEAFRLEPAHPHLRGAF